MGARKRETGKRYPVIPPAFALGYALCHVWTFVLDNGDLPVTGVAAMPVVPKTLVEIVVLALIAAFWRRFHPSGSKTGALWAFATAGTLHVVLAYGVVSVPSPEFASVLSELAYAVSFLSISTLWCDLFGSVPLFEAVKTISLSFIAAAILDSLIALLPHSAYFGIALVLPFLSSLSLMCAYSSLRMWAESGGQTVDAQSEEAGGLPRFGARTVRVALFPWELVLLAVAFPVLESTTLFTNNLAINVFAFGLAGAIVLLTFVLSHRRFSMFSIMVVSFPLMLVGLLAGSLLGWLSAGIAQTCMRASSALLLIFIMVVVSDRSYRFGLSAVFFCAVLRILIDIGSLIGLFANALIMTAPLEPAMREALLYSFGIVVFVAVLAVWLRSPFSSRRERLAEEGALRAREATKTDSNDAQPERPDAAAQSPAAPSPEGGAGGRGAQTDPKTEAEIAADAFHTMVAARCRTLSEESHMSARESEVLLYLALGLSVARIEEKLVISPNTVKTHVRHIYRKLGIHSRDELKVLVGIG